MHGLHEATRAAPQRGLFLFFVLGMFMLQIAFAFTIHGDIGPRTAVAPGADRPASPALVGRIDSLLTSARPSNPLHPAPVASVAPAQLVKPCSVAGKKAERAVVAASASTKAVRPVTRNTALKPATGGRYFEYTITRGDTLDSISRKLYGSTQMVTAMVRLNRLTDDRSLRCGETLRVPRVGLAVASR